MRMKRPFPFIVGAACIGIYACGGTAIIDPPSGAGGASATAVSSSIATTATQSTGSASLSCAEIAEQYESLYRNAQSCELDSLTNPCTSKKASTLVCPCAEFFLNPGHPDFPQLDELQQAYEAQDCGQDVQCPDIGCVQPTMGECVPAPAGGGVCQSS